jgi:phosphoglycolate phosphatase-like HAD superfamily hydrolase
VLIDGMPEYWWAARAAALGLAAADGQTLSLPETAPAGFAVLRPRIHQGWEMVLMAAELGRPDFDAWIAALAYDEACAAAQGRWGWTPQRLQHALEGVRHAAIATDREAWLALHRPYPGVCERLTALSAEGSDWLVLTTKGGAFAQQLLEAYGLRPLAVYGHEQGSKPEVLLRLSAERPGPLWFVEDRRPTLETVGRTPGLEAVRCFLVAWGYLGPGDSEALPRGITLLSASQFARPLADWP